jgi:mannitol/fructose-specific phosphotransferase system IIA component (Ntr-type)
MAAEAHCSVLMVKAPRHVVHSRFVPPSHSQLAFGDLGMFTTWAACGAKLEVRSKDELLSKMARRHNKVLGLDIADEILGKLHKRDRQQSTALPGGVALIGATKNGLPATSLGIFTTQKPISWGVRGDNRGVDRVDVCLVVLSPPSERRTQLWMLGRLSRMINEPGFLAQLRQAADETELINAVREADGGIDRFLEGSDTSTDWAPVQLPDESDEDLLDKL